MAYKIQMLAYYGKLADNKIEVDTIDRTVVLALRQGAISKPNEDPRRTADEVYPSPIERVSVSPEIQAKADEVARNTLFRQELLHNIDKINFDGDVLHITQSKVNYGSLVALRGVAKVFPEEAVQPIMDQIRPMGVIGVLVNEKEQVFYMGRRSNVLVSGQWMVYPAGTVGEKSDPKQEIATEAKEEANMTLGVDGTAYLVGMARGWYHSTDPNFSYAITTDWSLRKLWENTAKNEHDLVIAVPMDEKGVVKYLKDEMFGSDANKNVYDKLVDAGIGTLLNVTRLFFGDKWYNETVAELNSVPGVSITNKQKL